MTHAPIFQARASQRCARGGVRAIVSGMSATLASTTAAASGIAASQYDRITGTMNTPRTPPRTTAYDDEAR